MHRSVMAGLSENKDERKCKSLMATVTQSMKYRQGDMIFIILTTAFNHIFIILTCLWNDNIVHRDAVI